MKHGIIQFYHIGHSGGNNPVLPGLFEFCFYLVLILLHLIESPCTFRNCSFNTFCAALISESGSFSPIIILSKSNFIFLHVGSSAANTKYLLCISSCQLFQLSEERLRGSFCSSFTSTIGVFILPFPTLFPLLAFIVELILCM